MDLERALKQALLRDENLEDLAPRVKKTTPASHWARVVLMERLAYLKEMARFGSGEASENLREFPGHTAQLIFRSRSGEAETDDTRANVYFVVAGAATLVTGGKLARSHSTGPGKTSGDTIEGGTEQQLRSGDVVHIPAGVPHRLLLTGEQNICCFALEIETPPKELP
ncbi:MAG: hypothetical protein P4K83_00680 [Terracidiphilus sp.]|nr:hypothetical protein [Terracidiphilus sp.]